MEALNSATIRCCTSIILSLQKKADYVGDGCGKNLQIRSKPVRDVCEVQPKSELSPYWIVNTNLTTSLVPYHDNVTDLSTRTRQFKPH
jgi:hypothetical protein